MASSLFAEVESPAHSIITTPLNVSSSLAIGRAERHSRNSSAGKSGEAEHKQQTSRALLRTFTVVLVRVSLKRIRVRAGARSSCARGRFTRDSISAKRGGGRKKKKSKKKRWSVVGGEAGQAGIPRTRF